MLDIITAPEWGQAHGRGWGARPLPARFATLHYSASNGPAEGSSIEQDMEHARFLDRVGFDRFGAADLDAEGRDLWPDAGGAGVSYTLLVSLSGRVLEGHEVDRQSSHTKGYNNTGVGIAVMYNGGPVSDKVIDALAHALVELVLRGELVEPKFHFGHRDVYATECPGDYLYARIPDINRRAAILLRNYQEADMATTALGWALPTGSGTRRVGPHIAHPDNPRELLFRNHATADLLITVAWLIHTGNGNEADMVYASQLHSARPLNAGFGASFSDHHCWVALDVNWNAHPWEVRTGRAAYDAHLAAKSLQRQHNMFAAIEKRLDPGRIVRWAGRDWLGERGTGYLRSVGNRDCMHWVIEAPNWTRINAAAERLRQWFRPPHTVADVKNVQRAIGVEDDGVWGHGSVKAMYAWERKNGLTPTGLPGTVAFWNKHAQLSKPKAPPVNEGFSASKIRWAQENANTLMLGAPEVAKDLPLAVDGSLGPATKRVIKALQKRLGFDAKDQDGLPGPRTEQAMRVVLALNEGFSMPTVEARQRDLKALGYYKGAIDGHLGKQTRDATEAFQRASGLNPDGLPGSATARALEAALAPSKPAPKPQPDVPGRIAGSNRYGTAAAMARKAPAARQAKVYLAATGTDDVAIAGGYNDGVVLLVRSGSKSLPAETIAALRDLPVKQLVPVGGKASVTEEAARAAYDIVH